MGAINILCFAVQNWTGVNRKHSKIGQSAQYLCISQVHFRFEYMLIGFQQPAVSIIESNRNQ